MHVSSYNFIFYGFHVCPSDLAQLMYVVRAAAVCVCIKCRLCGDTDVRLYCIFHIDSLFQYFNGCKIISMYNMDLNDCQFNMCKRYFFELST